MSNTMSLFKIMFPVYNDKIIGSEYIGDMETIFYMSDNSKVIFDELDKTAMYIAPRNDRQAELSEEEWRREFSRKLKRKLALKNITNMDLVILTGLSYNSICRYTRGERVPDIFTIKRFAKVLNCEDISELTNFDYLL